MPFHTLHVHANCSHPFVLFSLWHQSGSFPYSVLTETFLHVCLTLKNPEMLKIATSESLWHQDNRGLSNKTRFPPAWTDQQQKRRTVAELWKDSASGFNKRPTQTADASPCQLLWGLPNSWLWPCQNTHTHRSGCVVIIIMTSAHSVIGGLWFCKGSSGWGKKGNTAQLLVVLSAQTNSCRTAGNMENKRPTFTSQRGKS